MFQLNRGNSEARHLRLLAFPDMFEKNVFGAGKARVSILSAVLDSTFSEKPQYLGVLKGFTNVKLVWVTLYCY